MRSLLTLFIISALLFTFLPGQATAVENNLEAEPQEVDDVTVGIDPQSPFWFLQRVGEKLRLGLTFRAEKKANLMMVQLQRREQEMLLLQKRLTENPANHRATSALERVMENYCQQIDRISNRVEKFAEKHEEKAAKLEVRLERMLERQQQRLEKLAELKENNPEAAPELERALEKGRKNLDKHGQGKAKPGK